MYGDMKTGQHRRLKVVYIFIQNNKE